MRKEGLMKRGLAAALVCAMAFSVAALSYGNTYAADAIDVDATCSLSVDLSAVSKEYVSDLETMTIPVNLYKVATVDVSGNYTEVEAFTGLETDDEYGLEDIDSETTAEEWLSMAKAAMDMVQKGSLAASNSFNIAGGSGTIKGLDTGMYLVVPQNTLNADYSYEYQFTPYLTALPGNNYYSYDDHGKPVAGTADDWIYNATIGLKVGREMQYGSLVINKTLTGYSSLTQEGYFVFDISGQKDGVTYTNVAAIRLNADDMERDDNGKLVGVGSTTISGIPVGMEVTVTEIYSGGSYEPSGNSVQKAVIVADQTVQPGGTGASVAFENQYNDKLIPGTGVLNQFTAPEGEKDWGYSTDTVTAQ